jgi:hypothetical protein
MIFLAPATAQVKDKPEQAINSSISAKINTKSWSTHIYVPMHPFYRKSNMQICKSPVTLSMHFVNMTSARTDMTWLAQKLTQSQIEQIWVTRSIAFCNMLLLIYSL